MLWITGKAIVFLIGTWGFMFFWFLYGICGYWFIFYKMQYDVYILMPSLDDYEENYIEFDIIFGLVLAC